MMKCVEVQNRFPQYWDMDDDNEEWIAIEAHVLDCPHCSILFHDWEDTDEMLGELANEPSFFGPSEHINRSVMDRIYAEESWLMPVPSKSYQFSRSFRRNLAIIIAACMAMFACAFFVFVFDYRDVTPQEEIMQLSGLMDTGNVTGDNSIMAAGFYAEVPVASISDPFVLKVVPAFPQYYVALSLLGLVMALLTLNWLSRTRN
jgi:hypothetical protein